MNRIFIIVLFAAISFGCKGQKIISGPLNVPDALLTYSAEGKGVPLVIFTGGENLGQKFFPKELKDEFVLIHADPSRIDSSVISNISYDDVLDDLERLRIAIGVEKIGIMGHSMFGRLPLDFAAKYPNSVSFVISTGSQPYNNDVSSKARREYWEKEASEERKKIREENLREMHKTDRSGLSPTQRFITRYIADTPYRFYDPNFDQSMFWEGAEINMDFLAYYGGTLMKNFDNTEAYRNIKAPVIVFSGKYDFGSPYYLWEGYNAIIPYFTHKVYENAGHNPFMEIPDVFAKDVLKWVKSID